MIKRRALFTAAILAPIAALAIAAGHRDDTASVKKNTTDFQTAWNKHDAKALAALWARDGDLICPDGKIQTDGQAVEKFFTEQYGPTGGMAKTRIDIKKETVRFISPDVALSDWDAVVTGMTMPDGVECGPMVNHVVIISKKESGNWKIAAARPGAPQHEGEQGEMKPKTAR